MGQSQRRRQGEGLLRLMDHASCTNTAWILNNHLTLILISPVEDSQLSLRAYGNGATDSSLEEYTAQKKKNCPQTGLKHDHTVVTFRYRERCIYCVKILKCILGITSSVLCLEVFLSFLQDCLTYVGKRRNSRHLPIYLGDRRERKTEEWSRSTAEEALLSQDWIGQAS